MPAMLLCVAGSVYSQSLPSEPDSTIVPYRFGIFAGIGTSLLNSVDLVIPGYSPVCGDLRDASGGEWSTGLVLDVPFIRRLSWHARLGIRRETGTMTHQGDPFPIRNDDGAIVDGRVDEVIDYRATGIDASLTGSTTLFEGLHAELGLGVWLRLHSEQTLREVAVDPAELLLVNNRREMELNAGNLLPYRAVVPLGVAGIRYDLPIGAESYLSPEIRLSYPILDRTLEGSWRSLGASLGASVRFGFPGARDDVIPPPDTVPPPPPVLVANVLTFPEVVTVEITEYDSTDWVPVLNGVFFDEGSATLPERYHQLGIAETSEFSLADLTGTALDVYHNVLNIIGLRMQRLPDATIRITGHRNGRETSQDLALRRAEAIRDYLVETWDIFHERIAVEGGGLPPKPVPERTQEGYEENAVARIIAPNPYIVAPVQRTYILRFASPPSVTFYPRVIAQAGLAGWQLDVEGEGKGWRSFGGNGPLPDSIRWDWTSDSGSLPSLPIKLNYSLTVRDSAGQTASTELMPIDVRMKPVVPDEPDTLIESYSLLLFDYDSPDVSEADRQLIRAITERVKPGAIVRFTGYTDSLGDAARNRQLGLRRAEGAAKIFREYAPPDVRIVVNDDGGERERFPFNLPEGRSYNRTVVIEVRTPAVRSE